MDQRRAILGLIAKNDGQWTWYQLERGLSVAGLGGHADLMNILAQLVSEGLISEEFDDRYPHPLYRMTSKGTSALSSDR